MKKLLWISTLLVSGLMTGCGDSSHKNSGTSSNEKTSEFFLNNAKERKEAIEKCFEMFKADEKNGKTGGFNESPECQAASEAQIQILTEERLESRISVKAFHDNPQAAIYFAPFCNPSQQFPQSPTHPTCQALIALQKQLQEQCKGQEQNYQLECSFNAQLTKQLGIKN